MPAVYKTLKNLLMPKILNTVKRISLFIVVLGFLQCMSANKATSDHTMEAEKKYLVKKQKIVVDGNTNDWANIEAVNVNGRDNLWMGEGLPEGNWHGDQDLSFSWKIAHDDGKLFFLIEVKDDTLSNFNQEFAWLNDCVEIHLDHQHLKGDRIEGINSKSSLQDRFGRRLFGHEMQFLPSASPKVFFDDSKQVYYTNTPQTDLFEKDWHGKVVIKRVMGGYIMETGFAIPNFFAYSSQKMGVDIAVCDDDGKGRKSLMVTSGFKGAFWLTMDNFIQLVLE